MTRQYTYRLCNNFLEISTSFVHRASTLVLGPSWCISFIIFYQYARRQLEPPSTSLRCVTYRKMTGILSTHMTPPPSCLGHRRRQESIGNTDLLNFLTGIRTGYLYVNFYANTSPLLLPQTATDKRHHPTAARRPIRPDRSVPHSRINITVCVWVRREAHSVAVCETRWSSMFCSFAVGL